MGEVRKWFERQWFKSSHSLCSVLLLSRSRQSFFFSVWLTPDRDFSATNVQTRFTWIKIFLSVLLNVSQGCLGLLEKIVEIVILLGETNFFL